MKLSDKLRRYLMTLLGLNSLCYMSEKQMVESLAHSLMNTPRIFGDKARLIVGDGVVLNDALINTSSGNVIIHDYVFCGHNASFITGTHDYNQSGISRQRAIPTEGRDIIVKEGVWIASNVTILGPAVIGKNSVIAAGSVVLGDVPSNVIFAGVPAKIIKHIGA